MNIRRRLNQLGALSNQFVAAPREWIMDRTWQRKYLSALLGSEARSDQRTAAACGLNHQRAERKAADQSISLREMPPIGRCSERVLADQRARRRDLVGEIVILCRVHTVDAMAKECDGPAVGIQCASMRGGIDALCEAADDCVAAARQVP